MRKFKLILFCLALLFCISNKSSAQFYSIRTDAVGLATGTFNAQASMALNLKWTLNIAGQYNPWTLSDNKKFKHWAVMPGARYWFKETYGRSWFIGANLAVVRFNIGGIDIFGLKDRRYDGMAYGGGLSVGYSLPIAKRWNIEFEVGGIAAWADYDKYQCHKCGDKLGEESKLIFAPSKASVAVVLLF